MTRAAALVVVAIVVGGCLGIPAHQSDAGATSGLSITVDGTAGGCTANTSGSAAPIVIPLGCTLTVHNGDYAFSFASTRSRMPSALTIGTSADLFATGGDNQYEDAMGYELSDGSSFHEGINDGLPAGQLAAATLTVIKNGPAEIEVEVSGEDGGGCSAGGVQAWLTRLSFFPDGRFSRHDELQHGGAGSNCSTLTSYTTVRFGTAPLTLLTDDNDVSVEPPARTTLGAGTTYRRCLAALPAGTSGPHVVMAFAGQASSDVAALTVTSAVADTITMTNVWADPMTTTALGSAVAADVVYEIDSHTSCDAFGDSNYMLPEISMQLGAQFANGLYETSFFGGPVMITAPAAGLSPGLAIEVDLGSNDVMVVGPSGQTFVAGVDFLIQTDLIGNERHSTMFFTNGLLPGDTLTITFLS